MADTGVRGRDDPPEREEPPDRPTGLTDASWWDAVKRIPKEFRADNLTDRAAALTYYSVLSVFPALLVMVSLVGLAGRSATEALVDNLQQVAPGAVNEVLGNALRELHGTQGTATVLALVGLAGALWSASAYVAAFMRASNAIYDVPEGRPLWKKLPLRVGVTVAVMILLVVSVVAVTITGGIAERVGRLLGVGSTAVTVWDIAKWPVLLAVVSFMFALLYWASPNARQRFRLITPGSVLAVVVWVIASAGFAFYTANFGSYNQTYGSLAGVIVFLVWVWLANTAILLGAELNAELERGRAITGGHPADTEPYMELRDSSKLNDRGGL
jgi:membrane protein